MSNELHRGDSRPSVRPDHEPLPPGALQRAVLLVGAVHDEGPGEVAQLLTPLDVPDLYALAVTLAALVPVDATPRELLAWNDQRPTRRAMPDPSTQPALFPAVAISPATRSSRTGQKLRPCGTRTAAERHLANGEELDPACEQARRDYYAEAGRTRRQRQREAAEAAKNSVDEVAVERACRGEQVDLNRAERITVIRRLVDRQLNDRAIAERLHMSMDAVCKFRERHGIPAGQPQPNSRRTAAS